MTVTLSMVLNGYCSTICREETCAEQSVHNIVLLSLSNVVVENCWQQCPSAPVYDPALYRLILAFLPLDLHDL